MTTLFSNHALKQSLGIHSLAGMDLLRDRVTPAISPGAESDKTYSTTASDFQSADPAALELQLYEARAQAKIFMSKVATYMDDGWKRGLYRQLDSLLDADEWMDGEVPLGTNSFATFMRLMLLVKPKTRPGLGLTSKGNLIASWRADDARLSVEFLPNDKIRFVLSHEVDDKPEAAAGDSTIERFLEVLTPYNPNQWIARATA